ncbi:PREDICTED: zinc finger MYM-type protein 1-like [Trachymyrmex cornetzi]|uniref:zinc finger MYM-type protein 1-like n=1 Tax=Trachymyrmex cornetzi TaxID=471704 RepID=UPI00084EDC25|nr:PREDICTED: zinc finger MYM-type protein 1-like [Trachymyrmex cornetzi]
MRERDIGRKYVSGAEKERKRKAQEEFINSQKGSMHKFLKRDNINTEENKPTQETSDTHLQNDELLKYTDNNNDTRKEEKILTEYIDEYQKLEDIGTWPVNLTVAEKNFVMEKVPRKICLNYFPKDHKNRNFSEVYYTRKMSNGELIDRQWLVYSKEKNAIFCFPCKLFKSGSGQLETHGFNDWQHTSEKLKRHEVSKTHFKAMDTWTEARFRAINHSNVVHLSEKLYIKEKQKWRNILEKLIAIIQYLAEHNMTLRGSSDLLNTPNNGNFLGLVELMARYDSILMEHVSYVKEARHGVTYLSKDIQNELISLMGNRIRNTLIDRIKAAKYFSVILDCTPDTSHEEQLSCIIRYIYIHNSEIQICESFTRFLVVKDTSGLGLATTLKQHLNDCGLDFTNCRGQGYDNGANMKGFKSGVQAQLLRENRKAFFTPCGCHNLNLVLADIANVSPKAVTFFDVIQRLYTFLSASNYRYDIAKKRLKLTPKTLSDTRWEYRVESVKAVRFQIKEFVQIFEEILTEPKDAKTYSEATSLLKEIQSFPFILSTIIWYELLVKVNRVSKILQQNDM